MFTHLKPRLRFIVDNSGGGEELGEAVPQNVDFSTFQESQQTQEPKQQEAAPTGGNPVYDGIRSKLDPISWKAIEEDLKAMDRSAQERITKQNEAYKPWKQFADAGLTPDQLAFSHQVAQRLDADPVGVYQFLENHLNETGRLPNKQELEQAQATGELGGEQQADPRIDQIAQQQQQIAEYIATQERQQQVYEAEASLDQEIEALKQTHSDLSPEDVKEVIARAALVAHTSGKVPTLEEAFAEFDALRNRIRSTPRPGDSAPRLPNPSGGVAGSGQPQVKLADISRADLQKNFADFLDANK